MHPLYKEFLKNLENDDKKACIDLVLDNVRSGKIDIPTLYAEVLTPSLKNMEFSKEDAGIVVWKEHIRSSIVRTIIESCYPYVLEQRKGHGNGKVVVLCPIEEYHEIGARMVADYFTLLGFEVTFVGANTPLDDVVAGIRHEKPKYVAISVSNFYNLVAAKRAVETIAKSRKENGDKFKILVGGGAFKKNPTLAKDMSADKLLQTYDDLAKLVKGGGK